ncbi:MAG TPA: hypothetical protein VLT36_14230 [Candidatus Dormibacteraeota bacterium]|nr:hypothetical protein [Candidatus Dormibacteraeota bacterium]
MNSPARKVVTFGQRKVNPRTEFRLRRAEEINSSPNLSERFPKLKSLSVTIDYFDSTGATRTGGMKYKINLAHAKSLLCFNCGNLDCIGADFDLSEELTHAIAHKR